MIKQDFFTIINDPLANKSACSIDFKTGSMNDPKDMLGLSHLVEHVISSQFSDGRIGVFNASTSYEHSNFRFETDHTSFLKALKTFVEALNSPLIDIARVDAEKKVINSEFEKNKYDQSVLRAHMLLPSSFQNGNMQTLRHVTPQDVKIFFDTHYGASNAKVAILTALTQKEVNDAVTEIFDDFRPVNVSSSRINDRIFKDLTLPSVTTAVLEDSLILSFEIDRIYDLYRTKPHWILNYLINTKRKGSLSKRLKSLGLATDVWSSIQPFSFSSLFFVEFKPTAKGISAPQELVAEFFSYMDLVNKNGYPEYLFREQKEISLLGSKFRERNDGMMAVKDLARLMHYYPTKDALNYNDVIFEYGQQDFKKMLAQIKPDNMKVLLCDSDAACDNKEKYYGISYRTGEFKFTVKAGAPVFKYPETNKFIMNEPVIYSDDKKNTLPYLLIDDKKGKAWFLQDNVLKLPMLYINLMILSKEVNKDPYSKLLSIVYVRSVSEALEETLDEAGEAGLSFGIDRDDKGIQLFFSGYSQKMPLLIKKVVSALKIKEIGTSVLNSIKNELKNDYFSLKEGSSLSLAQYFKYQLIHKNSIPFNEYIELIDKINTADLVEFVDRIYKNISIDSHIYGNVSPNEVTTLYDIVFTELEATELPNKDKPKDAVINYGEGNSFAYCVRTNSLDHCWSSFYQFGARSIKLSAVIQLGNMFLAPYFFDNIRGKKQLGYLAETRVEFFEKVLGVSFVILSDEKKPDELAGHAEQALRTFPKYLQNISKEVFENSKRNLVVRVNKNNRTLEDWMNDIFLTSVFDGDTQYAQKLAKEIMSLSIEDVSETFHKAFDDSTCSRMCVYASPAACKPLKREVLIEDIMHFKKDAIFY